MAYDMNVVKTAYNTAVKLNASDKIILALFEAGIVESGFRNLDYGDSTSLGFLQQKPEYWGGKESVMNVATATTSFVNKAKPIENKYATAGQLAQGVQRSAYPYRYDEQKNNALKLINSIKGNFYSLPVDGATEKNISSKFGEDRGDHLHGGIDIAMPYGSRVFTVFGGTVYKVGYDSGGYGNYCSVLNQNGYTEFFGHFSRVTVKPNQVLNAGDKVGEVGSTGRSTGNHLHYEIRDVSGNKIDPLKYLKEHSSYIAESKEDNSIGAEIKKFVAEFIAGQLWLGTYMAIIIVMFISLFFIFKQQKNIKKAGKTGMSVLGGLVDVGASFIPGGTIVTKGAKTAVKTGVKTVKGVVK